MKRIDLKLDGELEKGFDRYKSKKRLAKDTEVLRLLINEHLVNLGIISE